MKKKILINILTPALFFMLTGNAIAQDFKNVNPKMNHVLTDTTYIRAIEVTIEPGQKSDMHTHPAHFFYALSEGKMIVHYKDGKDEPYDLKPGVSGFSVPERPHTVENIGMTTIKFLLVELKEHPYMEPKKK